VSVVVGAASIPLSPCGSRTRRIRLHAVPSLRSKYLPIPFYQNYPTCPSLPSRYPRATPSKHANYDDDDEFYTTSFVVEACMNLSLLLDEVVEFYTTTTTTTTIIMHVLHDDYYYHYYYYYYHSYYYADDLSPHLPHVASPVFHLAPVLQTLL